MAASAIQARALRRRDPRRAVGPILAFGALTVSGLWCGVGCGAADSVSQDTTSCKPQICLGNDAWPPVPPPGPTLCPAGACNYQTQKGCPAGATCGAKPDTTTDTVAPACLQAGSVPRGGTCDSKNLCAPGLQCIHTANEPGICRALCCSEKDAPYGDWTACPAGESCIRQIEATFMSTAGPQGPSDAGRNFVTVDARVMACIPVNECDVLDSTSCSTNNIRPVCRIVDPLGNVACRPPGHSTLGDPCSGPDQCGPVQICAHTVDEQGAPVSGPLTCRRLCRVGGCGEEACPTSEGVCVHFHRDPKGVGECTPLSAGIRCYSPDGGIPTEAPHDAGTKPDASTSPGTRDAGNKG